jgi:hypothetical protein
MLAGEALAMRDLGESAGDARDSAVRGIEAFTHADIPDHISEGDKMRTHLHAGSLPPFGSIPIAVHAGLPHCGIFFKKS